MLIVDLLSWMKVWMQGCWISIDTKSAWRTKNPRSHWESRGFVGPSWIVCGVLLVPRAGIEPARREAADFESAASASSTIRAALQHVKRKPRIIDEAGA